jgi:chromosome segregation ATPase
MPISIRRELDQKLATVTEAITETNRNLKDLAAKRAVALKQTDGEPLEAVGNAAAIKAEIAELQEKLENLTVLRAALEGKIQVFKGHAEKAATVKKQIIGELYPKAVRCYRKIPAVLAELSKLLAQIDEVNGAMRQKADEYATLTGGPMIPPCPQLVLPLDSIGAVQAYATGTPYAVNVLKRAASVKFPPISEIVKEVD